MNSQASTVGSEKRHAIVIGGGLIGCMSAYYLQQFGWQVTLLERDTLGSGASHGNCGYVCPSHALPLAGPGVVSKTWPSLFRSDSPLAIPPRFDPRLWSWLLKFSRQCNRATMLRVASARDALLASSMQLYRELLATERLECGWEDQGLLLVFRSSRDFQEYQHTADLLGGEFGIEATAYPGNEVKSLEPALRAGLAGGWHFPGDAHVRPDLLLASMRAVLDARGAKIHEHAPVQQLSADADRQVGVITADGEQRADQIVVCTGAEAGLLTRDLDCHLPIQPGKGYSLTMSPLECSPRIPMIFEEHHVAVTPMQERFRVGSTMEFTGFSRRLNPKRLALLRHSAELHLESPLPADVDEQWTGWRPMVYDGLPCVGFAPGFQNCLIAAGNGMIGLATAPATGKLVAELASRQETHLPHEPYAVSRFE